MRRNGQVKGRTFVYWLLVPWQLASCLLLCWAFVGCSFPYPYKDESQLRTNFTPGQVYVLQREVFLVNDNTGSFLAPPGYMSYPASIQDYQRNGVGKNQGVIGVLPVGTRILYVHLLVEGNLDAGPLGYTPMGKVLDAPYLNNKAAIGILCRYDASQFPAVPRRLDTYLRPAP